MMVLLSCCSNDTSLAEVDALIEVRQQMQQQHQARLDSILAQYPYDQMTDEERFECCGRFFELYRSFHLDSQSVYVQKRLELASRMSNPVYMQAAQMNKAEVMMRSGMYHEAVLCLIPLRLLLSNPPICRIISICAEHSMDYWRILLFTIRRNTGIIS